VTAEDGSCSQPSMISSPLHPCWPSTAASPRSWPTTQQLLRERQPTSYSGYKQAKHALSAETLEQSHTVLFTAAGVVHHFTDAHSCWHADMATSLRDAAADTHMSDDTVMEDSSSSALPAVSANSPGQDALQVVAKRARGSDRLCRVAAKCVCVCVCVCLFTVRHGAFAWCFSEPGIRIRFAWLWHVEWSISQRS
jgi:hypothetical protein